MKKVVKIANFFIGFFLIINTACFESRNPVETSQVLEASPNEVRRDKDQALKFLEIGSKGKTTEENKTFPIQSFYLDGLVDGYNKDIGKYYYEILESTEELYLNFSAEGTVISTDYIIPGEESNQAFNIGGGGEEELTITKSGLIDDPREDNPFRDGHNPFSEGDYIKITVGRGISFVGEYEIYFSQVINKDNKSLNEIDSLVLENNYGENSPYDLQKIDSYNYQKIIKSDEPSDLVFKLTYTEDFEVASKEGENKEAKYKLAPTIESSLAEGSPIITTTAADGKSEYTFTFVINNLEGKSELTFDLRDTTFFSYEETAFNQLPEGIRSQYKVTLLKESDIQNALKITDLTIVPASGTFALYSEDDISYQTPIIFASGTTTYVGVFTNFSSGNFTLTPSFADKLGGNVTYKVYKDSNLTTAFEDNSSIAISDLVFTTDNAQRKVSQIVIVPEYGTTGYQGESYTIKFYQADSFKYATDLAPDNFTATNNSYTGITLTWDELEDTEKYRVERESPDNRKYITILEASAKCQYNICKYIEAITDPQKNLNSAGDYTYTLRAINYMGNGSSAIASKGTLLGSILKTNKPLNARPKVENSFTNNNLLSTVQKNGANVIYKMIDPPSKGSIKKNSSNLSKGNTFSQNDIVGGKINYFTSNSSVPSTDSFTFWLETEIDGETYLLNKVYTFAINIVADRPPEKRENFSDLVNGYDVSLKEDSNLESPFEIDLKELIYDPDGDEITFSELSVDPKNIVSVSFDDENNSIINLSSLENAYGDIKISFEAQSEAETESFSLDFNIENVDDPPVVKTSIEDITVSEDQSIDDIDLRGLFKDIDNDDKDILKSIDGNSNSNLVTAIIYLSNNNNNTLKLTLVNNANGQAEITIKGLSNRKEVSSFFQIKVEPVNDPPVNTVSPTISGIHHYGETLTINNGTWNDDTDLIPGTLTYTYQWQRADDAMGTNTINLDTINHTPCLWQTTRNTFGHKSQQQMMARVCL